MMSGAAIEYQGTGEIRFNEPMASHCSWRTGGVAELFFEPAHRQDLLGFLKACPSAMPITWIGLGSNLLVRDGGIAGVVIGALNRLSELESQPDGTVYAECGVTCARLARFCDQHDFQGAEFFAGIPGTMGGALAMNAGAWGGDTWSLVTAVDMVNRGGQVTRRKPAEFKVGYRCVEQPAEEWFLGALLQSRSDNPEQGLNMKELLEERNRKQPIGLPSCGSVFKNPPGDHAARLIEAAGLKGCCVGSACVSDKHANFIINTGGALAADIESLIHRIQQKVAAQFQVDLETEVRIIGEPS